MSNAMYVKAREGCLNADIDWISDDIRCILIDTADYTVNLATDEFLDDVPGAARVSVSSSLSGKTATNGVADANDAVFTTVTGDQSEALVIYQHTGTDATSRLIAYIDSATGLPITPSGGNINVVWDNGSDKIFKL